MRLGILSCHQSYKQIIGENTSQNKSINVLVVYDQKHRYAACICYYLKKKFGSTTLLLGATMVCILFDVKMELFGAKTLLFEI